MFFWGVNVLSFSISEMDGAEILISWDIVLMSSKLSEIYYRNTGGEWGGTKEKTTTKNNILRRNACVCDCMLEALDATEIQKNTLLSPSEAAVCSRS